MNIEMKQEKVEEQPKRRAEDRTYEEWVAKAMSHERRTEWEEAYVAWSAASRLSTGTVLKKTADDSAAAALVISHASKEVQSATSKKLSGDIGAVVRPVTRRSRLAVREAFKAKARGLVVGAKLEHVKRGKVIAECDYAAPCDFRFDGKSYTSISGAAIAACEALGLKSRTTNGWKFWSIAKSKLKKVKKEEHVMVTKTKNEFLRRTNEALAALESLAFDTSQFSVTNDDMLEASARLELARKQTASAAYYISQVGCVDEVNISSLLDTKKEVVR